MEEIKKNDGTMHYVGKKEPDGVLKELIDEDIRMSKETKKMGYETTATKMLINNSNDFKVTEHNLLSETLTDCVKVESNNSKSSCSEDIKAERPICQTPADKHSTEKTKLKVNTINNVSRLAETCISFLEKFRDNGHSRADDCIKWLESMMDCRSVIDTLVSFINEFKEKGYENATECIDWLEGIKRNSVPDSVFMTEENCEPDKERAVELNMEDGSCVEFLEKFSSSVSGSAASKLKAVAKCLEKSMLSAALSEIYMDELKKKVRFYEEFLRYLHKNAIGNTENIVDAVNDVSQCDFIGYVDVFKSINDNQQLVLEFTTPEGEKKKALWSADDNYAVWQTCGIAGDDYSGYLLFPTQNENSYFCIYYDS